DSLDSRLRFRFAADFYRRAWLARFQNLSEKRLGFGPQIRNKFPHGFSKMGLDRKSIIVGQNLVNALEAEFAINQGQPNRRGVVKRAQLIELLSCRPQ